MSAQTITHKPCTLLACAVVAQLLEKVCTIDLHLSICADLGLLALPCTGLQREVNKRWLPWGMAL
jgi:hypothetical protein